MTAPPDPSAHRVHRSIYGILIAASVGIMIGRILAVDSVDVRGLEKPRLEKVRADLVEARRELESQGLSADEVQSQLDIRREQWERQARLRRPFLSANDRSRWCTLRALVEKEMRVPGAPYAIDKVIQQPQWDTIDMVKHDGYLYSSKPPLFPTLLAAPYWIIHRVSGATLGTHPYEIGRFILILVNVLPMAVYLWLLARLGQRFAQCEWSRVFVLATAAFGTFLTTFAVVVNNHLPAAVSVMIAIYAAVRIWFDGQRRLRYFAIAGLFAAFAASDELPALALAAPLGLALLWKAPRQTLAGFVPATLVIAAAFFGTNWIAHHSLRPPYAHRSKTDPADNWYQYGYVRNGREYRSYWEDRKGIDRGEPSRAVYALHALAGHHGIFSLSPVWLLSVAGIAVWLARGPLLARRRDVFCPPQTESGGGQATPLGGRGLRELALLIAVVSVACLGFYLGVVDQGDRNYGGMTSGLRWMFWLIPMWLVAMFPAADLAAQRRWSRGVALALLAVSALSASYPTWNPWTHPWLYNFMEYLGWPPQ